jgi:hypothetical protein
MVAIIMPSIDLLIKRLKEDFSDLTFVEEDHFSWAPNTKTVAFSPSEPDAMERLLHELAHAKLDHHDYDRDIDLIAMERDAWQLACTELSQKYEVPINTEVIETHMDTYRDWLHARSTCPHCTATGLQIGHRSYKCVACLKTWDVNEARVCGLKRYKNR